MAITANEGGKLECGENGFQILILGSIKENALMSFQSVLVTIRLENINEIHGNRFHMRQHLYNQPCQFVTMWLCLSVLYKAKPLSLSALCLSASSHPSDIRSLRH